MSIETELEITKLELCFVALSDDGLLAKTPSEIRTYGKVPAEIMQGLRREMFEEGARGCVWFTDEMAFINGASWLPIYYVPAGSYSCRKLAAELVARLNKFGVTTMWNGDPCKLIYVAI
jgi:hypothetical protein